MKPQAEHESEVFAGEAPRPFPPRVTVAIVGGMMLLALVLVMAASGVELPDAKTTAKTTAATGLAILVTIAGLAFGGAALLNGRLLLSGLGLVVFLGGVSVLATTLGLPEEFQVVADGITSVFDLINNILALLNRLIEAMTR